MGENPTVASADLHFWEEPVISGTNGSGAVFFSGCSMNCIFCQNQEISQTNNKGKIITANKLADVFKMLYEKNAHNINLVTATHFIPSVVKALNIYKPPIPIIYNCGGYENIDSLKMLDGLIDVYLPDFKYADDDLAEKFSGVKNYTQIALNAIKEMKKQQAKNVYNNDLIEKGVIIRHLILPLHTKNSIDVLNIINENFTDTPVSLMAQYTPVGTKIEKYPELTRPITKRELEKVQNHMLSLNMDGYFQSRKAKGSKYIPNFNF
ncbi:MAG: radical SAM protein [Clostridia bacterium]